MRVDDADISPLSLKLPFHHPSQLVSRSRLLVGNSSLTRHLATSLPQRTLSRNRLIYGYSRRGRERSGPIDVHMLHHVSHWYVRILGPLANLQARWCLISERPVVRKPLEIKVSRLASGIHI